MDKQILVTGGTGFLGSYLLRYLVKKGYRNIRALKRGSSSMSLVEDVKNKIEWVDGDLLETVSLEEAMKDVQQVYHCGAMVSFDPKAARQVMRVNVEGTANVVNLALDFEVEKLVHISSIAALGRTKDAQNVSEATHFQKDKTNSNYSISKYLSEQEVWRGIAEGLPAAILNPSVIMGSGFWNNGTAQMFQQVWDGLSYYPVGSTGFVDVRDVAKMSILLMESDILNERIIANAKNLSYQQLFTKIAQQFNKKPPSIRASSALSGLVWRMDWLKSKLTGSKHVITKETADLVSGTFFFNNAKSLQHFAYEYLPVENTLEYTGKQFVEAQNTGQTFAILELI